MITSDIIQIKRTENFDNSYVENCLKDKNIIRWAIVDVDDDFLTLSVSYLI